MVRRPLRYLLATTFALTGCSALLDVKDIYFDSNAGSANAEGGTTDGNASTETSTPDGGVDGTTCTADTAIDPLHCGRCGHSCLGGMCSAGVCQAVELATVTDAPLSWVVVSDQHVFTSGRVTLTTQTGGVWRLPKAGGMAELYADLDYARMMGILADKLYFVVDDYVADGTPGQTGGLYSCPLTGPAPCTPTRVAPAESPAALVIDKGRVVYGDDRTGKGLMAYTPPAAPVVFRDGFGFSTSIFADGQASYYVATFSSPQPPRAKVFEVFPDAGFVERYAYDNANAEAGRLFGNANELFFTAYDLSTTTGGVVRRIPRTGGAPCDVGGNTSKRPYGIYADGTRIYWTNLGDGAAKPFQNGSLASCEQAGCCTTPTVMWTGNGQPEGVTGDAEAIYFVTSTSGSVWKIAKP